MKTYLVIDTFSIEQYYLIVVITISSLFTFVNSWNFNMIKPMNKSDWLHIWLMFNDNL